MRQLRVSVSTVVSLLVVLATIGAVSATSQFHQGGRRRSHAARVTRVGATRLDHNEAITHEVEQHDPVLAVAADGLSGQPHDAMAPRGASRGDTRVHLRSSTNAALVTTASHLPHRTSTGLSPVRAIRLQSGGTYRSRSRAPPHVI